MFTQHGHIPTLISNLFCTLDDIASGHARYHWGAARAIYEFVENELLQVGRRWTITTPSGTNVSGIIGVKSQRASYLDERQADYRRTFHSGAYCPAASESAEGIIVCEYTGGSARRPCYNPPVISIENNRVVSIEAGRNSRFWVDQYKDGLDEKVQRFGEKARTVDSWHGGANPAAECIPGLLGYGGTRMMHFHLGRTAGRSGDYLAAEISHHNLKLDGHKIYENGKLVILNHPKVKSALEPRFTIKKN